MRFSHLLLTILLLYHPSNAFHRMYETTWDTMNTTIHAFHCLYNLHIEYRSSTELDHDWGTSGRAQMMHYCRRTIAKISELIKPPHNQVVYGEEFTFSSLREMGVSAQQLYDWYAPMDTIEEYISGKNTSSFYNCSQTKGNYWFGPWCQYTFGSEKDLADILNDKFLFPVAHNTCYPMNDGICESILCLDWREICDGKMDCKNGIDEHRCHELEINECNQETEYRCLNGQCIDKIFVLDNEFDCMDESDERLDRNKRDCFPLSFSNCEDRICPSLWFSCGDGYCYDGPNVDSGEACYSKRDRLYLEQMPSSKFILFSHVFLIYDNIQPKWICYNETLCPYLSLNKHLLFETFTFNGSICRAFNTFTNRTYLELYDIIKDFKSFILSCSIPAQKDLSNNCSLFKCNDNSKCFSFHRLSDGYKDCSNGEDERQENTCSLNISHRYSCDNGTRCIHSTLRLDDTIHCADKSDEYERYFWETYGLDPVKNIASQQLLLFFNITFPKICNGVVEYVADAFNNTDETDCSMNEWRCSTSYSRCNGVWNCPDGRDELNCGYGTSPKYDCDNSSHFCSNITNGYPMCLPRTKAGDGIIDCVGSLDERTFCRVTYPNDIMRRYRCRNSDQCISPFQVCDCHQDCPENDDEITACVWLNNNQEGHFCQQDRFRCRDGQQLYCPANLCHCRHPDGNCKNEEQRLFCDLIDYGLPRMSFLLNYVEKSSDTEKKQVSRSLSLSDDFKSEPCNRGLLVRYARNPSDFYCFCSDHYYGDYCQYQRKRISIHIRLRMKSSFNSIIPIFKIVLFLIRQKNDSIIILSHEQFLYAPQYDCLQMHITHLLYPINESYSSSYNHSVHIYAFTAQNLELRASWQFLLPLDFLPVNRIAKELFITDIPIAMTQFLTIISTDKSAFCSNNSLYLGYDVNLGRDICICPLNHTGRRCMFSFNPCTPDSCNEHGECVPIDERYLNPKRQFLCLCDTEWGGKQCDKAMPRIHISFSSDVLIPASNIALVHSIYTQEFTHQEIHFHHFHENIFELTIYLYHLPETLDLIFVQLYEHLDQFDYYLLVVSNDIRDKSVLESNHTFNQSDRCQSIEELFNATVIAQPRLRRVKYYQQPCVNQISGKKLQCFYDDELMCICDQTNHVNCFNFNFKSFGCPWNTCSNRGRCVQNHAVCPSNSVCICQPCTYGPICQFSTDGYSISLDAILGSHIRTTFNIFQQTKIIQISLIIFCILSIIGIILNIFAIATFSQRTTRDVGCGLSLLISSCLGLLTMIVLMCKIISLISFQQRNVSCALIEFLLKWWPISSEWLNAYVAIERTLTVIQGTSFSTSASRCRAKWIAIGLIIFLGLVSSPEYIFRQIIIDEYDGRSWCVFTLNSDRRVLHKLYSITNILLFVIPLTINLICPIVIILGTIYRKQKSSACPNVKPKEKKNQTVVALNKNKKNKGIRFMCSLDGIKEQILKYKYILTGPILLGILSLPRLVFAFIFVCKKLDRRPLANLFPYLIGFLPSMTVFFAYVLPSEVYYTAFISFIKRITPQSILSWLNTRCRRS
ncbi:unnamed protein product [Adineta steineri]|uniref:Uncharacterized protein n=2 Tax=Adineta steineri TaxID=433720 RepID=A0A818LJA8_9BILA|nr:unnamed protein product [Adineta steineri]